MTVAFFGIDGWEPKVKVNEFRTSQVHGASKARTREGQLTSLQRFEKQRFEFKTPWLSPSDSKALINTILGRGHYWDFENSREESSRGLCAEPGHNGTVSAGNGYDSSASLRITSGGSWQVKQIINDRNWNSEWTVLFHHRDGTNSFSRYGVRSSDSSSQQWKDGTQGTHSIANFLDFTSPDTDGFDFLGKDSAGSDSQVDIDNVMILPWIATDEQMTAWSAVTSEGSPLPLLRVRRAEDEPDNDNGIDGQELFMLGEIDGDIEFDKGTSASTFYNNLQMISVALSESYRQTVAAVSPLDMYEPDNVVFWVSGDQPDGSNLPQEIGPSALGSFSVTAGSPTYTAPTGGMPGFWSYPAGTAYHTLTATATSINEPCTAAALVRRTGSGVLQDILSFNLNPYLRSVYSGGSMFYRWANLGQVDSGEGLNNFQLLVFEFNASADKLTVQDQGVSGATGAYGTQINLSSGSIIMGQSSGNPFEGDIAQIIVWDKVISPAGLQAWMAAKWSGLGF